MALSMHRKSGHPFTFLKKWYKIKEINFFDKTFIQKIFSRKENQNNKTYNLYKRKDVIVIKEKGLEAVYYFYYQNNKVYVFKDYVNNKNLLNDEEKKNYLKRLYKVISASTLMQDVIDKNDVKKLIK